MATTDNTIRPPQAIQDALWQIRRRREGERSERLDSLREGRCAQADSLFAAGAVARHDFPHLGCRTYTFIGSATGKTAVFVYDVCRESYTLTRNDTRFTEAELLEAVASARLAARQRADWLQCVADEAMCDAYDRMMEGAE